MLVVAYCPTKLHRFIDSQPHCDLQDGQYLLCTASENEIVGMLASRGLREFQPQAHDIKFQEQVLNDYLRVIDLLARENRHNKHWWATDIASKNRFVSPLVDLLACFVNCLQALETEKGKTMLVVVAPPWPVTAFLEHYARVHDLQFNVLAHPWSRRLARLKGFFSAWYKLFKGIASSVVIWLDCRRHYGSHKRLGVAAHTPVYLIKSFCYAGSFLGSGNYQDPFWGGLADYLDTKLAPTVNVMTTVVCQGPGRTACLRHMRSMESMKTVPLESFLTLYDIIVSGLRLTWGRLARPFQIPERTTILKNDIGPLLRECLISGGWQVDFYQFLHQAAGKRLSEAFSLQACAITFEGNPWEKMFMCGLRIKDSNTPVYGYQHSVIPMAAAGVFLTQEELYDKNYCPTKILTTGDVPAKLIKHFSMFPPESITSAGALRYDYLSRHSRLPRKSSSTDDFQLLVALEGVVDVVPLVKYVLEQACGDPDLKIRIRAHPILPFATILKKIGYKQQISSNVSISKACSVVEDVSECDAVLYWGSTVALESLGLGKPVIHFDRGDPISYDPLFDLDNFKWKVSVGLELKMVVGEICLLSDNEYESLQKKAHSYLMDYFHLSDKMKLSNFLPQP